MSKHDFALFFVSLPLSIASFYAKGNGHSHHKALAWLLLYQAVALPQSCQQLN